MTETTEVVRRPKAVVGLIRAPNDLVLVISRSIDGGKFGLPGGKVENSETLLEGLSRELFEELGINVVHAVELYSAPTRRHQTHVFSIQTYHGVPRSRENENLDWRHFKELMNSSFCAYAEWYREFFSKMGWL